jgi:hypothetical protein
MILPPNLVKGRGPWTDQAPAPSESRCRWSNSPCRPETTAALRSFAGRRRGERRQRVRRPRLFHQLQRLRCDLQPVGKPKVCRRASGPGGLSIFGTTGPLPRRPLARRRDRGRYAVEFGGAVAAASETDVALCRARQTCPLQRSGGDSDAAEGARLTDSPKLAEPHRFRYSAAVQHGPVTGATPSAVDTS